MYARLDARTLTIDRLERRARLGIMTDELCRGEGECLEALVNAANIAFCATRVAVSVENGALLLGGMRVESTALSRVLCECNEAYLLVVTLGVGADRLALRAADTYTEFLVDALADCLVEAAANEACSRFECKELLTNRFSPGYADLDIATGRYIVAATGADRLLGVRFTDSGLMTPKKTVSAIVGIKGSKE